jgi:hypothetical protein
MPDNEKPTLDEFFEYDQMPKPMAPAPEEPMRVNVNLCENGVPQADYTK